MDLDGSIFWWVAGALVLAALVVSAVGIRGKADFPPSGAAMWGILAVFALVVVGTGAYAVANASEEKEHREQELAEEEEAAAEENSGDQAGAASGAQSAKEPTPTTEEGAIGKATTLDVTSPEDGGLSFEPSGLEAPAGVITLAYENPSPVPHNIALEDEAQKVLDQSDDVTAGSVEITSELAPGEYAYFCAIPGHREAGMEGVLTID
ncbi:MAG: plastocyanin/azurin family copper-binding protein [Solirubrobacterales bacterium]